MGGILSVPPGEFSVAMIHSRVYPHGYKNFIAGKIDITSKNIRCALVLDSYVFRHEDEFFNDVQSHVIGDPVPIIYGTDIETRRVKAVTTESTFKKVKDIADRSAIAAVIYKQDRNIAFSLLIAVLAFEPIRTDGGNIVIVWKYRGSNVLDSIIDDLRSL